MLHRLLAFTLILLGVAAILAVIFWANGGLDSWLTGQQGNPSRSTPAEEARRSEELARLNKIVSARTAAKKQTARDLVDGRLTLLEAAAALRRADREPPDLPGRPPVPSPGQSEGECYCRAAITWVLKGATGSMTPPELVEELRQRLEKELDELLKAHGGKIILPE